MSGTLDVAIAGAGLTGGWHARYASRLGARVVAVVDSDPERAAALSRRHRGAAPYASLEAALGGRRVHAVHVCTPTHTHAELTRACLEARVSALVEKPLAAEAGTVRALHEIAQRHGVILCPVLQFGFQRGVTRAVAAIAGLGRAVHFDFQVASAGAQQHDAAALDQVVVDIAPHLFGLLQTLWPAPLGVHAGWLLSRPLAGEVHLLGEHAGVPVSAGFSLSARPTRCEARIACTGGALRLDLFHGFLVREPGRVSRGAKILRPFDVASRTLWSAGSNLLWRAVTRRPAYPGLQELVEGFYAAVRGGAPAPVQAPESVAVADACDWLKAALGGLPAAGPRPGES